MHMEKSNRRLWPNPALGAPAVCPAVRSPPQRSGGSGKLRPWCRAQGGSRIECSRCGRRPLL
eukprot:8086286-Pyramimonas_sp.AAC.1